MSYDADDPDNLLGSGPARVAVQRPTGANRALSGDVRVFARAGERVQLVDIEYDRPRVVLVTGKMLPLALNVVDSTQAQAIWRIGTGLDRSILINERQFQQPEFNLTVVARSLSVTAESVANLATFPQTVQAVAVPMDVSCDPSDLSGLDAKSAGESPNLGTVLSVPQTALLASKGTLDALLDAQNQAARLYSTFNRRGFAVYNATLVNMFLQLGILGGPSANAYSVLLVPGAYYESPYGYSGGVSYWFAAAGVGEAYFTVFGAS